MRRWVIGFAGLAVVVATGVALYLLRYRTDTTVTPIGVGEAVAQLDAAPDGDSIGPPESATAAPAPDVLPAVGVYTYTTTGGDEVDALGGASHVYPDTSLLTVRRAGCGVSQVWAAARERSDEYVTCATAAGVELVAWTEFHRFFDTDDRQSYVCAGDPRPVGAPTGTTWTTTCRRDGETAVWTGEVLAAAATASVGTEVVAAEHVVWTVDNGDPDDVQRIETWYLAGTDLVVRRIGSAATVEDSVVGVVRYHELYEINLDSLTPTR